MSITKQIAIESELRFAAEFSREGWNVFLPYGEDNTIDLLLHKKGAFSKVQVKACAPKNGVLLCKLRSTNNWQDKRYSKEDIDFLALYDYKNKKGYLLPFSPLSGMAQFSLRLEKPKNAQKKGIHYANDYLFF